MSAIATLTKLPTGIGGFDTITRGGLPADRSTLILGGPGCGKSIFALQTLVNAARSRNEPGIFVAFEERAADIVVNAASFGWSLQELVDRKLFFLDARLGTDTSTSGSFDLSGMLAGLGAKAKEIGARWIVFDAIDVLLTMLDDRVAELRELYRLRQWLSEAGLTGIITAKIDDADPVAPTRYGELQFLSDCVIRLEHRLQDQVSLRELRVIKYRGSSFSENLAYFVLGAQGVEVADVQIGADLPSASLERTSSGVSRLDTMLGGGFYRGSAILLTGLPGTAKTTLACAFAASVCRQGEKVVYCAFDESPAEIQRNLATLRIDLKEHVASGRLVMVGTRTDFCSSEEHFVRIAALVEQHQPSCIVVDPFSTLTRAGGDVLATSVARRLVGLTKCRGITLMVTALQEGASINDELNQMHVSTIADTWIHLSYHEEGGERNRALSIVKSRGSAHSKQLRELLLSAEGITLANVYASSGEVLMGTLRWEREEHEQRERLRVSHAREGKRRELELALADVQSRLALLNREMELRRAHLELLEAEAVEEERTINADDAIRQKLRNADSNGS
ncbi:MAG: circadian clock protein KaiC [Rhodocyclaceae bacterium]